MHNERKGNGVIQKPHSAIAAKLTRAATRVSVGNSVKITALRKNDPPQINDRLSNITQSNDDMRIGILLLFRWYVRYFSGCNNPIYVQTGACPAPVWYFARLTYRCISFPDSLPSRDGCLRGPDQIV